MDLAVSLPITDRRRAHDFYRDGLGLEAVGPLADDGLPEPLQFLLGPSRLLLIPEGGFTWALGGREAGASGDVGCLLTVGVATDDEVVAAVERAAAAGGTVLLAPSRQPWGMFAATVADPDGNVWLVTSEPLPG